MPKPESIVRAELLAVIQVHLFCQVTGTPDSLADAEGAAEAETEDDFDMDDFDMSYDICFLKLVTNVVALAR